MDALTAAPEAHRNTMTTILTVRHDGKVAMGGDGQVSLGSAIMKADAVKIRRLMDDQVLCGFAGTSADAFALLERFEAKLRDSPANLMRAAIELAKQWRTDRSLRRLESLLVVADLAQTLMVSGQGDVIEPSDGVCAIGSGGPYALAAARALLAHTSMPAAELTEAALRTAGEICIYSNTNVTVVTLPSG